MLRYVYIACLVQYAEYLMDYEAKYFLTVRFISFAMIRLAFAVNCLEEVDKNTTLHKICVLQWNATGWMVQGSNPGGGEIFCTCPDQL
jgi:hypothetical protein